MLKNNKQREEFIRNDDNWKLVVEHPDGFRVSILEIGTLTFHKFEIQIPTFYKLKDDEPDTHWVNIGIYMKKGNSVFQYNNYSVSAMVTEIRNLKEST